MRKFEKSFVWKKSKLKKEIKKKRRKIKKKNNQNFSKPSINFQILGLILEFWFEWYFIVFKKNEIQEIS